MGLDAKSVRSVRKRSPCVRNCPRPKIVAKRKTVVTFGLSLGLHVSRVSTVTGTAGVLVAKRRNVVAFRLALGPRVSKVSTVTGTAGVLVAKMQNCRLFLDWRWVFASQKCQQSQGSRGSWSQKRRTVVTFGLALGLRVSKVSTVTRMGGSWSRSAELSSLLDSVAKGGREERRERREERREKRGEEERIERRGEKRREERRNGREDDLGPKSPDWFRA